MTQLAKKFVLLLVFGVLAAAFGPRGGEAREVQLLMALDISGSMKVTDPLRLLPKAAQIMVELLDEKDSLGVLTFEDVTQKRLPCAPLSPPQRRKGFQELSRLQPRGLYTDLYQVQAAALKCFGPPGQAKQALLLISDGQMDIDPSKGNSKAFVERVHQEIIPAYKKAGIPIYTVAFTPESDQTLLKSLAEQTGGRFLLIPEAKEIHQAFTKIYEDLKGPQVAPLVGNHFIIDQQVQEAILVATRSQQGKSIGLETPKGGKLGPASKGIRWFSAPTFDMVTLPHPEPGKWTVSGHKEGEGKIILMTDLQLECPHLPDDAGADEALIVGALLKDKSQPVTAPEVLVQTVFTAELQKEGGKPVKLSLGVPPVEQQDLWPPGVRVAKFPTFTGPGIWHLKLQALGKTFQRERNISFKVTDPWYQARPISGDGPAQLEFIPFPGRKAAKLAGWINLRAADGGISGKFVEPPLGKNFRFVLPPGLSGPCLVNLEFRGITASGRPLVVQPLPLRLLLTPTGVVVSSLEPKSKSAAGSPAAVTEPKSGGETTASAPESKVKVEPAASAKKPNTEVEAPGSAQGSKKTVGAPTGEKGDGAVTPAEGGTARASQEGIKDGNKASSSGAAGPPADTRRKWLWAALLALAALGIIGASIYLFRPRALRFLISRSSEDTVDEALPPEQLNLLLKAQVETLQKEKGKLQSNLGEAKRQVEKLSAAKEELEAKLGKPSKEYQEKTRVIKELEQKLEEAEKEAKSVQEEYMALYARSQREKQSMKEG